MKVVTHSVTIQAPIHKVFDAYVQRIDEWWPRAGEKYRYSFAPGDVQPDTIQFEAQEGGRFYEVFANGDEYVIGTVQEYSPPHKIAYTWKDPEWQAETLIEITFEQQGEATLLQLRHSGFEKLEQPELAEGYEFGSHEIYGHFKDWLESQAVAQ